MFKNAAVIWEIEGLRLHPERGLLSNLTMALPQCDRCHRPAVVHDVSVSKGVEHELHLCEEHAPKAGPSYSGFLSPVTCELCHRPALVHEVNVARKRVAEELHLCPEHALRAGVPLRDVWAPAGRGPETGEGWPDN